MKIKEKVDKTIKTTLHKGNWWACINEQYGINPISLWHIRGGVRRDMVATKGSIEDLKLLCDAILEELENEEV